MDWATGFAVAVLLGAAAFMVYRLRRYEHRTSRHALAGAFSTMNLGAAILVGALGRPSLIISLTQGMFILVAVVFFGLEVRLWRADRNHILGGKP
jgi:hypothetical protein